MNGALSYSLLALFTLETPHPSGKNLGRQCLVRQVKRLK